MNVIETERLSLREMSEADSAFVLEVLNDPDFIRYVADRGVRTAEDAARYIDERFVESYRRNGFGLWLVATREGGLAVGVCGLVKRDSLPGVDIGYAFLPQSRGKGYAYEAASAVLRHARDVLGLPRLYAITDPENAVSMRVLEKLGMKFERLTRLPGEESDINLFSADL